MRIGTAVLTLMAALAIVSCNKKTEAPPSEPAPETKAEKPVAVPTIPSGPGTLTEGIGEAESPPIVETPEMEIKNGVTYVVGQGDRAVVMNAKPVDDGRLRFPQGSVCRIDPEGKVKVIGKRLVKTEGEEHVEYLVRYTRDPAAEELRPGALEHPDAEPYECPTGTLLFLEDASVLEEEEVDTRFEAARKLLNSEKP